jgi:hypothetical protein
VVAAPYHRLEKGILANDAILRGTPAEALLKLRALGVDYVALCADRPTGERSSKRQFLAPPAARQRAAQFLDELELPQGRPSESGKLCRAP